MSKVIELKATSDSSYEAEKKHGNPVGLILKCACGNESMVSWEIEPKKNPKFKIEIGFPPEGQNNMGIRFNCGNCGFGMGLRVENVSKESIQKHIEMVNDAASKS